MLKTSGIPFQKGHNWWSHRKQSNFSNRFLPNSFHLRKEKNCSSKLQGKLLSQYFTEVRSHPASSYGNKLSTSQILTLWQISTVGRPCTQKITGTLAEKHFCQPFVRLLEKLTVWKSRTTEEIQQNTHKDSDESKISEISGMRFGLFRIFWHSVSWERLHEKTDSTNYCPLPQILDHWYSLFLNLKFFSTVLKK